ncbi:MAG TPA: nucleotidyltransferase substrate binding protein [Saprospiraceae bacterium]|nr:nucleotidyltransferase substrate binding protein [Saprospiraceae bacterium]
MLRQAAAYGIIDTEVSESWMTFRDLRNLISHEYGENFAQELLSEIPKFIETAKKLGDGLKNS